MSDLSGMSGGQFSDPLKPLVILISLSGACPVAIVEI